ncbi:MAG TPA: dihydrodipicolinate reductase C-terminal domain-containing protein [Thermoanaerobaculia bacterium]|nr:dihydrodipicolinate reductase C-terminal domain-containing protein [Thermoanaerobaculia bacterium]
MRIAIHGYGKMGKTIEKIARDTGHEIAAIFDSKKRPDINGAEVVIDFSQAKAVDQAVDLACSNRIALVIGTTGWNDRVDDVRKKIENAGIGAVYASNFSPGANVTFALARRAGELFARFPQYAAGIEERHHAQKKDAPSGTALRIAREVKEGSGGKLDPPVVASRVGSEFGFHTLFFDSPDDLVEISHRARGREGFARGALMAAEMVRGRKGLIRFEEMVMS